MAFINSSPTSPWGLSTLLFVACLSAAGCSSKDEASGFQAPAQTPSTPDVPSTPDGETPPSEPNPPSEPTGPIVGSDGESLSVAVDVDNAALGAGGSTLMHLNFTDQTGDPVAVPGTWTAESPCSRNGRADIAEGPISTSRVSFTYTASGCAGEDEVTFTNSGEQLQEVSTMVTVDPDQVAFLTFVSAEPTQIGVRGSGTNEKSVVTFQVNGESSSTVADQLINFRLEGGAGGIRLVENSATTDSNGLVTAIVLAGSTTNNVTVRAEHVATGIVAVSNQLVVAHGLAAANRFSIEPTIDNPNAWRRLNEQGTEVIATVTDRFGNPVVDGTLVNFISQTAGSIDSHCRTVNNTCTVAWKPDNRNPANGRAKIFATVKGMEDFIDNNGNAIFDEATTEGELDDIFNETFDLGEPFSDNNNNGIYDPGEHFVDSNGDQIRSEGDGLWNGLNCAHSNLCSEDKTFVDLGAETIIFMSNGDNPTICEFGGIGEGPLTVAAGDSERLSGLYLSDGNNGASNESGPCPLGNPLPAGTTVTFTVSGGTLNGRSTWTVSDEAFAPTGPYGVHYTAPDEAGSHTLTLTVAVPGEDEWDREWELAVEAAAEVVD